jgi:hypothetical protein
VSDPARYLLFMIIATTVALALTAPIFQLIGEGVFWLKYGFWYNYSLFDLGFVDTSHIFFNTTFLGFNSLAIFLFSIWITIPVSCLALLGLFVTPVWSFVGSASERPYGLAQHLYFRSEVFDELSDLKSQLVDTARDLKEFRTDAMAAVFLIEDAVAATKATVSEMAEDISRQFALIEETLRRLEAEIADVRSDTVRIPDNFNREDT